MYEDTASFRAAMERIDELPKLEDDYVLFGIEADQLEHLLWVRGRAWSGTTQLARWQVEHDTICAGVVGLPESNVCAELSNYADERAFEWQEQAVDELLSQVDDDEPFVMPKEDPTHTTVRQREHWKRLSTDLHVLAGPPTSAAVRSWVEVGLPIMKQEQLARVEAGRVSAWTTADGTPLLDRAQAQWGAKEQEEFWRLDVLALAEDEFRYRRWLQEAEDPRVFAPRPPRPRLYYDPNPDPEW